MKIIAATNNKGKVREFKEILAPLGIEVSSLAEEGIDIDVEETGATFEENAFIKARAIAQLRGCAVLADDSGLCVDALGGKPGVYSARWAGEGATDAQKIEKLLSDMEGKDNRRAHFETAIAYVGADGKELLAKGRTEGVLLTEPHGVNGFGYDPIFLSDDLKKTFAEATDAEKNSVSHRGRALRKMYDLLKEEEK